jgi:hypothetical protein
MSAITEITKLIEAKTVTADGTSAVTSDGVDTQGWGGVRFFTSFGTAAAGNTIKLQASDDDAATDAYSDLAGTSLASTTSEGVVADLVKPRKRWARAVIARGTTSTLGNIWAELYDPISEPYTQTVTGTIVSEISISPDEGTA